MMDFGSFWEDLRKDYQKYNNLSPKEKLTYRIDKVLKDLNIRAKQSIRDMAGRYIGEHYLFESYDIEEILNVLNETKRIIKEEETKVKCTSEEWDHCRVEKMGCAGCYYDDNKLKEAKDNLKKLV